MTNDHVRPTLLRIDLDAVRDNVRVLAEAAGTPVLVAVKADGYGHGAVEVARAALDAGAQWLGVALVEEGLALREGGVSAPVLVLSELPPGSEKDALARGLTSALYTDRGLEALAGAAGDTGRPVGVHVKVDTGMHRVGVSPEGTPAFVQQVLARGLRVDGLWTHFASADTPEDGTARGQLATFLEVAGALRREGVRPRYLHAANSAATVHLPESHLNLVRVGIAAYGVSMPPEVGLRPAMSVRSTVTMVKRLPAGEAISYGLRYVLARESTIATVPIGYADGYARRLSAAGRVLIRGRRHPVAGTITMDQLMVDCGDDPVEVGDEVVLIGRQGDEAVTADEVAGWLGTIAYEVVCAVGPRVPRRYRGRGA